jgi:autophagy-related protein 11
MFLSQNTNTRRVIESLRRISVLNEDIVRLPAALGALQDGLKRVGSFAHIQRLHGMLYAYGATMIEIVRRKEFCKRHTGIRYRKPT